MPPSSLPLIALAGNPNAGKTTAFNYFTGSRQHVGNYPGITVEKKEGIAHVDLRSFNLEKHGLVPPLAVRQTNHHAHVHEHANHTHMHPSHAMPHEHSHEDNKLDVRLIDLPGAYSLTAYTEEERVARQVIAEERPLAVMALLNSPALERNLYLVVQLLEMGVPIALGLNMMDEARHEGVIIDTKMLSERLHVPVVETVGRTGEGLDELLAAAYKWGRARAIMTHGVWQPLSISYGPDLDPAVEELTSIMEKAQQETHSDGVACILAQYPSRWLAIKILEQDEEIFSYLRKNHPESASNVKTLVDNVTQHLRATLGTSAEAIIADYRYGYISSLLRGGVLARRQHDVDRMASSDMADKVITHQIFGPFIMLAILYLMYTVTFSLGAAPMGWVEAGFSWLHDFAEATMPAGPLKSMLIAGVIDGVGGVMGFVPLILIIFLQIAILEDSGYMARMAYMLDRVFRIFGLHGSSVVPYILGGGIAGGCAVPGILAARTLRSPREKLATILTVPFMACGAKLPVFILFAGVFFPGHEAAVMFSLTLAGWGVALLSALLLRLTLIRGPATPFVMELPPYRYPTLRGVLIHSVERTWQYLKKAGTVILAVSVLLWAAMTYPSLPESEKNLPGADKAALQASLAGQVGAAMEPVTRLAGFGWEANIALIGGFAAKEVIVTTLGTAYSLADANANISLAEQVTQDPRWNNASALAFLIFVLLYAPCMVTLVAIRQETGSVFWSAFSFVFNTTIAFAAAICVYQVLS